jgi:hypothetical protein
MRNGVLIVLLGALFLFFGISSAERSPWNYFLLGSGIVFAVLGLSGVYSAIRFKQK